MIRTAPVYAGSFYCVVLYSLCLVAAGIVPIVFNRMHEGVSDSAVRSAVNQDVSPFFLVLFGGMLAFAGILLLASNLVRLCILFPGACCKSASHIANKEIIRMLYGWMVKAPPAEDEEVGDGGRDLQTEDGSSIEVGDDGEELFDLHDSLLQLQNGQSSASRETAEESLSIPQVVHHPKLSACSSHCCSSSPTECAELKGSPKGKKHLQKKQAQDAESAATTQEMLNYERLREDLKRVTAKLVRREQGLATESSKPESGSDSCSSSPGPGSKGGKGRGGGDVQKAGGSMQKLPRASPRSHHDKGKDDGDLPSRSPSPPRRRHEGQTDAHSTSSVYSSVDGSAVFNDDTFRRHHSDVSPMSYQTSMSATSRRFRRKYSSEDGDSVRSMPPLQGEHDDSLDSLATVPNVGVSQISLWTIGDREQSELDETSHSFSSLKRGNWVKHHHQREQPRAGLHKPKGSLETSDSTTTINSTAFSSQLAN